MSEDASSTREFRRPPWVALGMAVVTAVVASLSYGKADLLTPVFRGLALAMVFWLTVVVVWEMLIPYLKIDGDRMTIRPYLFIGSADRLVSDLRQVVVHNDNHLQLVFDKASVVNLSMGRVSKRQRDELRAYFADKTEKKPRGKRRKKR